MSKEYRIFFSNGGGSFIFKTDDQCYVSKVNCRNGKECQMNIRTADGQDQVLRGPFSKIVEVDEHGIEKNRE